MDSFNSSLSAESDSETTSSPEISTTYTKRKGIKKGVIRDSSLESISNDSDSSISSIKSGREDADSQRKSFDSAYSSQKETSPRSTDNQPLPSKIENLASKIREKKILLRSKTAGMKPVRQASLKMEVDKLEIDLKALQSEYEKRCFGEVKNEPQPRQEQLNLPLADEVDGKSEQNLKPKRVVVIRGMDSITNDALQNLHDSLSSCPAEKDMAQQPEGINIPLMPHQRHGLAWMLWREQQTPSGGILADDMGLGKTLSMISLILKQKEDKQSKKKSEIGCNPKGGTLVVCPPVLLGQWKSEIENKCKQFALSLTVYHGSDRLTKNNRLLGYDVVLTTYGIVQRECKSVARKGQPPGKDGPVYQVDWTRIILDEAHTVRNYKSKTSQAVSCLKGTYRWAITGTPIHNKELDIFSLLVFIQCSPFDKYLVWCRWIDNKSVAGGQRMNMLMKTLMLRRTKDQLMSKNSLICLPYRKEHSMVLDLDELEQTVYDKILITSKNLFARFLDQHAERAAEKFGIPILTPTSNLWKKPFKPGDAAAALKKIQENSDVKSHHIFVLLLRLRQICCHPALIQSMLEAEDYKNEGIVDEGGLDIDLVSQLNDIQLVDKDDVEEEVSSTDELLKNPLTLKNPVFKKERPSTKLKALMQCLEEKVLNGKDKAVVVSQWTSMLDLIGIQLKKKNIRYCLLSGSVPLKERMDIIDDMNNNERGPKVLLLSLQAGGVGLNLVGANHLLLVDLHWNPQLEAQACDRIYRVGQKKGVHIYRFVCKLTVEEKIQELQEKKLSLADSVLTGAKNPHGNKLTMDDLKTLFSFKV